MLGVATINQNRKVLQCFPISFPPKNHRIKKVETPQQQFPIWVILKCNYGSDKYFLNTLIINGKVLKINFCKTISSKILFKYLSDKYRRAS